MVHPVSDIPPASAINATTPPSMTDTPNPAVTLFNDARKLITANADVYVDRLSEAVTIPSISTDLAKRDACFQMADLLNRWIEDLGGRSEKVLVGFQELDDGNRYDLPPVIFAEFRDGPARNNKPTVLVYGHYDVHAVSNEDDWTSDPFQLAERDENLFARGVVANKGPVLTWLWAVEVYRELGAPLPVNLKLCIEGMAESNSECLQDLLEREAGRNGFLSDVDYVVASQTAWLTPDKPCLTYGLRGLATFQCEVKAGSISNLSSEVYSGCIAEPMTDVVQLLAMVSNGGHGNVELPGCERENFVAVSGEELELYKGITFDMDKFRSEAGDVGRLIGENETEVLMNRWRFPAVSIHGIEGGHSGTGMKTVIAGSATGKFSIRLVAGQDADEVEQNVRKLLEQRFAEMESGNELTITSSAMGAWVADAKCSLYQAGAAAVLKVHGVKPDLIRDGGSIGVIDTLQRTFKVETMVLPIGGSENGMRMEDEKISRKNYLTGVHVMFTAMAEIARVHVEREDMPGGRAPKRGAFGRLKDIWYGLS